MSDYCLIRPPKPAIKTASDTGLSIYLTEEVGDARLRCNQLKTQINEAMAMVEKSEHRDHFFEIAGHLIYGIPDTLMRLEKALDATAMALAKWSYQTIKDEIRPEKVQQLDDALKDVRTRRAPRRSAENEESETESVMKASETIESLKRIAGSIERTGKINAPAIADLIVQLEGPAVRTASSKLEVADVLRNLAASLSSDNPYERPSRLTLATALRRVLGDSIDLRTANLSDVASEEKQSRFESGKPADPTENMSKEDADEWHSNKEKYKDKFKEARSVFAEDEQGDDGAEQQKQARNLFAEDSDDDEDLDKSINDNKREAYDWKA